jgi:hypothetical protein
VYNDTETQVTLLLAIEDNQGYSPDDVRETLTLGDLIQALQEAAEQYGDDARLVLDNGQQYGAQYGGISTYRDLLVAAPAADEDVCECGGTERDEDGNCVECVARRVN